MIDKIDELLKIELDKNNVNFDANHRFDYVDDSYTDVLKSVVAVVKKFNISAVLKPLKDKEVLSFEDWRIDCDYYKTVAGNFVKGDVRYTEEETRFKYKTEYLKTL